MKLFPVPALDHDKMMAEKYGHSLDGRMHNERLIVACLIGHLADAGFHMIGLDDGDGELNKAAALNTKTMMELVFNLDECHIHFQKQGFKKKHWVYLIFGNGNDGKDLISDYCYAEGDPDGFNAAMEAFDTEQLVQDFHDAIPALMRDRHELAEQLAANQQAWDGEEDTVKEEHSDLIAANEALLARVQA